MARRLSFSVAQPITIVGWYLSSFLLIGDVAGIIHTVQKPGLRRALTQAFYYAIFAASIYFVIASLMVFTVYGAWKGHYSKEFKLSMSQRTLMLQTISFMIYMVGGAGVYAKVEGWMFLDALVFTNYTLLTVGIGYYAVSMLRTRPPDAPSINNFFRSLKRILVEPCSFPMPLVGSSC